MKRFELQYSPRAEQDLIDLYDWIADQSSTFTADSFMDGLRGACKDLQTFPLRGDVDRFRRGTVRRIGYKRTVTIVFLVQGDVVRILRLLYRGRNVQHASLR